MELFTEVQANQVIGDVRRPILSHTEKKRPKIDKLPVDPVDHELTTLGLFFTAPYVLNYSNILISLPIKKKTDYRIVVSEIAPHFEDVLKISYPSITYINIEKIRQESRETFIKSLYNNELTDFLIDIYGSDCQEKIITNFPQYDSQVYNVNLSLISKTYNREVELAWKFIKSTYLSTQNFFNISPKEWIFNDDFREHVSVQSLAAVCESMWITVNTNLNKITHLTVC